MPDRRKPDGDYADPEALIALVSSGGRLRNQLDARRRPSAPAPSTVIVDPALLVGLDDLSRGRHLPDGVSMSKAERQSAKRFLDDLVGLARRDACWVLDFDRPDILGITQSPSAGQLTEVVERATATTLARFQLTGRGVSWPTGSGVTAPLLSAVRGTGERPVLVTSGSPARLGTPRRLARAVPGAVRSDAAARQRRARHRRPRPDHHRHPAPAHAQRGRARVTAERRRPRVAGRCRRDHRSRLEPRRVRATAPLDEVFDAPFVDGVSLEDLMNERLAQYDGTVPRTAEGRADQRRADRRCRRRRHDVRPDRPHHPRQHRRRGRTRPRHRPGARSPLARAAHRGPGRRPCRRAPRRPRPRPHLDRGPRRRHALELGGQLPGHHQQRHRPPGARRRRRSAPATRRSACPTPTPSTSGPASATPSPSPST